MTSLKVVIQYLCRALYPAGCPIQGFVYDCKRSIMHQALLSPISNPSQIECRTKAPKPV